MDKNDYKDKIEEHRKPIKLDGEESANSRMSRRSSTQPAKQTQKSRNYLLPILFAIFILIPFGFLIYIQVFYQPNQNETAELEKGVFEYKENEEDKEEDKEEGNVADQEESQVEAEEGDSDSAAKEKETESEENTTDEPAVTEPEEEEQTSLGKTHIVQPNETLYRIAMNYYNSPDAVEKIKEANGLTTDSISSGQELILP